MIKHLLFHIEKNFLTYEDLLKSKKKNHCCLTYAKYKNSANSFADRIFLIERYRAIQRKSFYSNYGFIERAIDILLSFNAKLRLPKLRLFMDLLALNVQTFILCFFILFTRRTKIIEAGINDETNGILMYPSFVSYIKNIHRPLLPLSNDIRVEQKTLKHFRVSLDILKRFQFSGLLIFLPTFFLELSLFLRTNYKNDFKGLWCLGTMCIINRFFAVIFKENGYSVHLKNHGIVRDCVAEYGIFTEAIGYKDGVKPIKEY